MEKPGGRVEIQIVPSVEDLALAAALHFVYQGKSAIDEKNLFTVALSGESLPAVVYSRLAEDSALNKQLSWHAVHCFAVDARHGQAPRAPGAEQSAREAMLAKLQLPPDNVHGVDTRRPSARRAAYEYERRLRRFFALKLRQPPRFDLVLLGIGADGRTALLFPGSDALREQKRLVIADWADALGGDAITMTVAALNSAALVIYLVSGASKAAILRDVLDGPRRPLRYPAQLIQPANGNTLWLVDEAAARLLRADPGES